MSDPAVALQKSIVDLLQATPSITSIVGTRIYDRPRPPNPAQESNFPCITLGGGQTNGDDIDCAEVSETFFQIHAWSRSPGWPQAKEIAVAIRAALRPAITVPDCEVQVQEYQQTQYLEDTDGLTRHAMVEFRFIIVH